MVALDPCVATFDAARAARCDMLVTHHPMLKAPIVLADESQPDAALAALAARRGLAVYAAHTNIDTVPGGINDILAGAAGIGSWFLGAPFLTSSYVYLPVPLLGQVPLASAALFDLGVFLTVVGATMVALASIGRIGERAE
jgi:hypothetical protein